jgi:CMP/dCMP kinase
MKQVITIARQYGSGGHLIGEKLAKKFGVPFYDRELIALAAKESGMSEEVFERADERAANSLLYTLIMGNYSFLNGVPMANGMPVNDRLFLLQSKIIKNVARSGPCVILGRCADHILGNRKHYFHVFVFADKDTREQRVIQDYGIKPELAPSKLNKEDKQRSEYYNFYTNKKWGDMQNYNMTVDSGIFGIDGTVELIAQAAELRDKLADEEIS